MNNSFENVPHLQNIIKSRQNWQYQFYSNMYFGRWRCNCKYISQISYPNRTISVLLDKHRSVQLIPFLTNVFLKQDQVLPVLSLCSKQFPVGKSSITTPPHWHHGDFPDILLFLRFYDGVSWKLIRLLEELKKPKTRFFYTTRHTPRTRRRYVPSTENEKLRWRSTRNRYRDFEKWGTEF